jgi:hypothetical protein
MCLLHHVKAATDFIRERKCRTFPSTATNVSYIFIIHHPSSSIMTDSRMLINITGVKYGELEWMD